MHIKAGTYRELVCLNRNKSYVTLRGEGAAASTIVGSQGSAELLFPNGTLAPNSDGNWPSCGIVRTPAPSPGRRAGPG